MTPRSVERLRDELADTLGMGSPTDALSEARVDLLVRIAAGIPQRVFVPGSTWLIAGKRYLIVAPSGGGKTLALLIAAVDVIEAGGTVAILDVENGADEYARRLADILAARDSGGRLKSACAKQLRYFEWPRVRMSWSADEWASPFDGVDLVVFDSSRLLLSAVGLAEDSNDDYATFVNALLVPLSRAGVTTVVLDNTGHEGERARGAKAKDDLNEVVYAVKPGADFDRKTTGNLRLVQRRTRFADLPGELHVSVGGATYGPITEGEPGSDSEAFRPTTLMEQISLAIEQRPGMSSNEVTAAVRGKTPAKRLALRSLVEEKYVRIEQVGQAKRHFSESPFRASEDGEIEGSNA